MNVNAGLTSCTYYRGARLSCTREYFVCGRLKYSFFFFFSHFFPLSPPSHLSRPNIYYYVLYGRRCYFSWTTFREGWERERKKKNVIEFRLCFRRPVALFFFLFYQFFVFDTTTRRIVNFRIQFKSFYCHCVSSSIRSHAPTAPPNSNIICAQPYTFSIGSTNFTTSFCRTYKVIYSPRNIYFTRLLTRPAGRIDIARR